MTDNALENKASLGHSVQRPESCHLTTPETGSLQRGARDPYKEVKLRGVEAIGRSQRSPTGENSAQRVVGVE